ncbi:hypothetical protein PTQ19_08500 [Microbacterium esteraromaticum]|uniref:hypothetical protein n=1 Tax=Microbacterium esteraromaticum TaxID=57043 RepID=UPI00236890FA|nr:hypothetical protein [Microbacterium esteraromaticum]WDH77573.1 hypothetical protein PTQ19_08500 [Microbacterium esteraromaticum]
MTRPLVLSDADTARDVLTFAGRAATASAEGVRLQAADGILVVTAAALAPQGFLDQTPTVLAMRIVRADPELRCDIVVDELSPGASPAELALPETGRAPAWAGVSPPRDGWELIGELSDRIIGDRAQWGISAVARGTTPGAGEDAVRALRSRVWGEPDEDLLGLPRGVAFAAHAFGFIASDRTGTAVTPVGEQVRITRSGRWTRLAFARGHILSRGPAVTGLTAVRGTGTAVGA